MSARLGDWDDLVAAVPDGASVGIDLFGASAPAPVPGSAANGLMTRLSVNGVCGT